MTGDYGHSIARTKCGIPKEARDLTWNDCFYDSTEGVVAVFDVNRDKFMSETRSAHFTIGFLHAGAGFGFAFLCFLVYEPWWLGVLCGFTAGFLYFISSWWLVFHVGMKGMHGYYHLAVLNDGIRLDCESFPSSTTFIRFSTIKAPILLRQNWCGCVSGAIILSAVSGNLQLRGLDNPHSFVNLVNAIVQSRQSSYHDGSSAHETTSQRSSCGSSRVLDLQAPVPVRVSNVPRLVEQITWQDPFYDSAQDVLAVFDVDFTKLEYQATIEYYACVMAQCTAIIFPNIMIWLTSFPSIIVVTLLVLWIFILLFFLERNKLRDCNRGVHIVMLSHGIQIDYIGFPVGAVFHTTIKINYKDIESISITSCCSDLRNEVAIKSFSGKECFRIRGLHEPRLFVDAVCRMIEAEQHGGGDCELVKPAQFLSMT